MGQYFLIVNPAKSEYISAGSFEENEKRSGVLLGFHANALAMLVTMADEARDPVPDLAGSWFGDKIYIVGDDLGKPDQYGIKTSTENDPTRNLYSLAYDEFTDISLPAIAMLCQWDHYWAEKLVERVVEENWPNMLLCLGNVVFTFGCRPLEAELEKRIGADWIDKYKQEWVSHGLSPVNAVGQWKFTPDSIKDWVEKRRR